MAGNTSIDQLPRADSFITESQQATNLSGELIPETGYTEFTLHLNENSCLTKIAIICMALDVKFV